MSEENNKVVINGEDIQNIEDFFNHFRIEIPNYLALELKRFRDAPDAYTFDDQSRLKTELAHALVEADHDLLRDELFKPIIENCNKEWYDAQFQRDFESAVIDEADESNL